MAGCEKTLFLAVAIWFCGSLKEVSCDLDSFHLQQVEDCKNVCRKNFKARFELKSCIDTCIVPLPPKSNGFPEEACIKDCLSKNPEGHALCELKCKNIPKTNQITAASTAAVPDIVDEEPSPQFFNDIQVRVSKMMDCLMDGMRHQLNYGWANLPGMVDPRMDKFLDDARFFKDHFPSELSPVKVEGTVSANANQDTLNIEKEKTEKTNEAIPVFGPILHRVIIIKKIPLFSYDGNSEGEQAADIAAADGMAERLKNLFSNIFSSSEADGARGKMFSDTGDVKASKAEEEQDKKRSNGKFCDFLSNMAHKSGLKRTTFILLMAGILLCFSWYCIATIINSKHQKGHYQEQPNKAIKGDLEYLVPIEEKLIFFAHLDEKEKSADIVQAPSIPIKIKIEEV